MGGVQSCEMSSYVRCPVTCIGGFQLWEVSSYVTCPVKGGLLLWEATLPTTSLK